MNLPLHPRGEMLTELEAWQKPAKVLDHGEVRYIEHWGSDERIIEAARMSTGKGFLGWEPGPCPVCQMPAQNPAPAPCLACDGKSAIRGDKHLLAFLYANRHATPFEMAGLVIEVQAPIFVFREWHRHRTQSYNEMSSRYIPLPDVNYIPSLERLMMRSGKNKQAGTVRDARELTESSAQVFRSYLEQSYTDAQELYEQALEFGVPKELARVHLPIGRYSRMRASANLRNWLGFLTLRLDPAAQWEIRQYAEAVGNLIAVLYPRTWSLFCAQRAS